MNAYEIELRHPSWGDFCVIAIAGSAQSAIRKSQEAAVKEAKSEDMNFRSADFECRKLEKLNQRVIT